MKPKPGIETIQPYQGGMAKVKRWQIIQSVHLKYLTYFYIILASTRGTL